MMIALCACQSRWRAGTQTRTNTLSHTHLSAAFISNSCKHTHSHCSVPLSKAFCSFHGRFQNQGLWDMSQISACMSPTSSLTLFCHCLRFLCSVDILAGVPSKIDPQRLLGNNKQDIKNFSVQLEDFLSITRCWFKFFISESVRHAHVSSAGTLAYHIHSEAISNYFPVHKFCIHISIFWLFSWVCYLHRNVPKNYKMHKCPKLDICSQQLRSASDKWLSATNK